MFEILALQKLIRDIPKPVIVAVKVLSPTAIKVLKHSFNADTDHQIGLTHMAMSALDAYVQHH